MSLFDSIPVDRVLDASWLGSPLKLYDLLVPFIGFSRKVLPLKPGVGQYIAMHATLTARDFFLISTFRVHLPAFFFRNLSQFFSCVGCC